MSFLQIRKEQQERLNRISSGAAQAGVVESIEEVSTSGAAQAGVVEPMEEVTTPGAIQAGVDLRNRYSAFLSSRTVDPRNSNTEPRLLRSSSLAPDLKLSQVATAEPVAMRSTAVTIPPVDPVAAGTLVLVPPQHLPLVPVSQQHLPLVSVPSQPLYPAAKESDNTQPNHSLVIGGQNNVVHIHIGSFVDKAKEHIRDGMKKMVLDEVPEALHRVKTCGIPVALAYFLLIAVSGVWGYLLSYLKQNQYLWILQAVGVWIVVATTQYFNWKPQFSLIASLVACFAAFGLVHDQFVETHIATRFNYPVTQFMEFEGSKMDSTYSILDPAFALRKVTTDCLQDLQSFRCLEALNEGKRVMKVTMIAMHLTLIKESIVEPMNVTVMKRNGPSLVIDFKETTSTPLNYSFPTLFEQDFHEMKLCALMAMRLKNGLHYFKEYSNWLSAEKNVKSWLDWIENNCMFAGVLDVFLRKYDFFGYWSYIKFFVFGIKQIIEMIAPDQIGVERVASWFVHSKTILHPNQYIDMCTVDRCFSNDRIFDKAYLTQDPVVVVGKPMLNLSCPTNLMQLNFDMDGCPILVEKCMDGLNRFGSRAAPYCPKYCQDALFLSDEDIAKRGNMSFVVHITDPRQQKRIGGSGEEDDRDKSWFGEVNSFLTFLLDGLVKLTLGGGAVIMHGGVYAYVRR